MECKKIIRRPKLVHFCVDFIMKKPEVFKEGIMPMKYSWLLPVIPVLRIYFHLNFHEHTEIQIVEEDTWEQFFHLKW